MGGPHDRLISYPRTDENMPRAKSDWIQSGARIRHIAKPTQAIRPALDSMPGFAYDSPMCSTKRERNVTPRYPASALSNPTSAPPNTSHVAFIRNRAMRTSETRAMAIVSGSIRAA